MACKTFKKSVNKVCVGNLSKTITLQKRNISAPTTYTNNTSSSFTTIATAKAMVITKDASIFVDDVNVAPATTTLFIIRYSSNIANQLKVGNLWILYNDNRFKVQTINNIDLSNKYIKLLAIENGSMLNNANNI